MATVQGSRDGATVDYRLNLLGIRVWKDYCCLIARSGQEWRSLGPPRPLPLRIPQAHELGQSWVDELGMTACQFHQEMPEAGLDAVLEKRGGHTQPLHSQDNAMTH